MRIGREKRMPLTLYGLDFAASSGSEYRPRVGRRFADSLLGQVDPRLSVVFGRLVWEGHAPPAHLWQSQEGPHLEFPRRVKPDP
jgi:hypothetical protein